MEVRVAKTHALPAGGVVARRAHQAQGHPARTGRFQRLERAAHRAPGVRGNLGMGRGVGVQVHGDVEPLQMFRGVGAQETSLLHRQRFPPVEPERLLALEGFHGGQDAAGAFRDARGRSIRPAAQVSYNCHARRGRQEGMRASSSWRRQMPCPGLCRSARPSWRSRFWRRASTPA